MTHQFGHEMGTMSGMYGWPYGSWTGGQTPIGATGQGMGGGEQTWQTPQMGQQFAPTGQMPWAGTGTGMGVGPGAGMGMGMQQPFGGFGGFGGIAPWHFFWQIENFLKQHPQFHYLHHQMLGNLLLSAPPQHYVPWTMSGQFPWQQTGYGTTPWTGAGTFGFGGQQYPWQQTTGFGGFGGMQPFSGGFGTGTFGTGMMPWQGYGFGGTTPWQGIGGYGYGQLPWHTFGFGGYGGSGYGFGGTTPWQFFWQLANLLEQNPQVHYGLHQLFGNLALSAPMQHFFPQMTGQMTGGQFPWQQQFGGYGGGMGQQFGSKLTDEQITNYVYDYVDSDPAIPSDLDFTCECRDGVVTLTGTCSNKRIKHQIGECCYWLPGVVDVNNNLRVTARRAGTEAGRERTGARTGQTGTTTGTRS